MVKYQILSVPLRFCLTLCIIFPLADGTIHAFAHPTEIDIGLTTTLTVKCTLSVLEHCEIKSPVSLLLSFASNTSTTFKHLASVNPYSGTQVIQTSPNGNPTVSGNFSRDGDSFLELVWQDPMINQAGVYKCAVTGLNDIGVAVVKGHTVEVSAQIPGISFLLGRVIKLRGQFQDAQKDILALRMADNNLKAETAANKDEIATNKVEISTDKADIATHKDEITTIKGEIATNKDEISTNKGEIATNKDAISTNKGDIATQKDEIATLKGQIATNKNEITTNKGEIATNKDEITTNKGEIATNKDEIVAIKGELEVLKKELEVLHQIYSYDSLEEALNSTVTRLNEIETKQADSKKRVDKASETAFDISSLYNGNRYYLSKRGHETKIYEAENLCRVFGGYLAEINDGSELQFVQNFIKTFSGFDQVFIGGTDQKREGHFVYQHSQVPVSYRAWGMGEPNNVLSNEDCITLKSPKWLFNDIDCQKDLRYLCEVPRNGIPKWEEYIVRFIMKPK